MIKFLIGMLKAGNIAVVVLYLMACLIPFLPAGNYWWIAVLGLVFPVFFFGVVFFLLVWIIARSKWLLLSLLALVISGKQLSVMAGLNFNKEFNPAKNEKTLRVLSYNLSSWGETSKSDKEKDLNTTRMIELVKKQQADVLCFQEFFDTRGMDMNDSILPIFRKEGYQYAYFVKTIVDDTHFNLGVAILSKYPFTDTARFRFGATDYAEHLIYADIIFQQQPIRIFNTHLQSVQFNGEEYSTLRKIKQSEKPGLKNSTTLVRKLKNAYRFRGKQADIVGQKINESPYPVIICGDFNDVPNSYTYFTIKQHLQDAFLQKGSGLGRTFQYLSPTLRIDYILADRKMNVLQFNRIRAPYSDHYPIITDLSFEK